MYMCAYMYMCVCVCVCLCMCVQTPSDILRQSIQLGLQVAIGSLAPKARRDLLMTDFEVVESVNFPA